MGTDAIPGAKRSSSQFRTDSKQPALPSRGSQSALARSISGEQSKASPGAAALGTTCISGAPAVPDLFASHHLPKSPPRGKRGLIHISSLLEAVKSTRPIYLPLYIPFVAWRPGRGAPFRLPELSSPFLWVVAGSLSALSKEEISHVSIEPPSLPSSPPIGRPSGRDARAVIG